MKGPVYPSSSNREDCSLIDSALCVHVCLLLHTKDLPKATGENTAVKMAVGKGGSECEGKNCEGERKLQINGSGPE